VRAGAAGEEGSGDGEPLTLAEVERRHILATLQRLGGNRAATARALGIGDNTLWRRLKKYRVPAAH
jgi:DNA-binding NtrC family response regulator